MKKIYIITLIISGLFAAGCQKKEMSQFISKSPIILKDNKGNKFVVKHHMGDTYTVEMLKE
jgi:ABC-type Fe3+-citrate transport system substrate-binding protein